MHSFLAEPDGSASGEACARIRHHLAQGAPWDACDAFRAAIVAHAGDPELLYCGALAHARSGATHEAHALLDRAQSAAALPPPLLADILSLRGRLWKDLLHRRPDAPDAATIAERAHSEYVAASSLLHDPYPGINAAALALLLGDRAAAQELATEVGTRLAAQGAARTLWDHATAGEAALLLGRVDEARRHYATAHALAAGDVGSVATMRRQLLLLSRVLPDAATMLDVVRAADVVAFTGHMVDAPDRATPRFPAALAPAVETAVRRWIADLNQPVFYGSAACGADLIVIESALASGAEVNIVLPFDRDDFVRTSVAVGGGDWLARFEAALARATRIIPATEERHLGDDVLFEHAARLVDGLAVLRASQLQTTPRLLCVIDAAAGGRVGGTLSAFERWTRSIGAPEVIDLAALRVGVPMIAPATRDERQRMRISPDASDDAGHAARPPRMLKTLVFADFAGYSRVQDVNAARFQGEFWAIAARQIAASAVKPVFANTWGDGLFVVFDDAPDGASFALRLSEDMQAADWAALGLPATSQIRICLHAGPVFCAFDPGHRARQLLRLDGDARGAHRADHAARHRVRERGVRRDAGRVRAERLRAGVRGAGRARQGLRRVARLPARAALSARSALRAQQLADVVREDVRALPVADVEAQPALRVEHERARAVVHRVGRRRRTRLLLVDDLEFLRRALGGLGVAVEPDERRIERGNVMRKEVGGVALRIDRREQHLHLLRVGPEPVHDLGELGERRRADVRALRVAEEQHDDLAAIIGERPRRCRCGRSARNRGRTSCR